MTAEEFLNLYYCELVPIYDKSPTPKIILIFRCKHRIDGKIEYQPDPYYIIPSEEPILMSDGKYAFSIDDNTEFERRKYIFLDYCMKEADVTDFNPMEKFPRPDITAYFTKPEPENPEN